MLSSIKVTMFLSGLLALTVIGSAIALQNQVQQNQNPNVRKQRTIDQRLIDEQQKKQAELESQFPIVDYDEPEVTNPETLAKRKIKNSRYDKRTLVGNEPQPGVVEAARINEGYYVPALPVAQSSLIVTAEVLNAQAHLSNDKGDIYTELTIQINEVIKNKTSVIISQGEIMTVEREGGIVRYSNGHKMLYHLAEEGMPATGRKYVLFLHSITHSQDYSILTGYELTPDGVVPVDPSREKEAYRGYKIDALTNAIRAAINESEKTFPVN
ncbi:MAG: hypothetical protein WCD76_07680 [Pyrinomonadaceae bacterium]